MTRRNLAQLAAAAALAPQIAEAAPEPTTPRELDPVLFSQSLYESAPRLLAFRAKTKPDALAWQQALRAKVTELVGGFPAMRGPLNAKTMETKRFPLYTREKFVFESRPGVQVPAYLLMPHNAKRPSPAIVCITGHGKGVDDIVGLDENGQERSVKPPYAHDFAIQVAEQGVAAIAIEPMGFGTRRDPKAKAKGPGQKACDPVAQNALLLGQSLLAWRVWDVMRTLDWASTRMELDAGRVGTMGISGGGTVSLFSAALDTRVKAAMVSCYLNTFQASIMAMTHCVDNYIPGILNWAEMPDIAGLIAPRPFFSEAGRLDPIFPVAASVESFRQVKAIYTAMGAPDLARQEILPTGHEFGGFEGIPFMVQHLSA